MRYLIICALALYLGYSVLKSELLEPASGKDCKWTGCQLRRPRGL